MKNKDKPTYYAVLTADVRYSTKLKANEKLLFAEITALSQKDGTCWASNKYFADLYGVSRETVSRWISNLTNENFVTINIVYKNDSKEIDKRYIRINQGGIDENVKRGIDENVKDNTTRINNIKLIKLFDEFWSNYPKKTDKKLSKQRFMKLSLEKQKLAIKDSKDRYTEKIERDGTKEYIPSPAVYINRENWEDERPTDNNIDYFSDSI